MEDLDKVEDGYTNEIEGTLARAGHSINVRPTTAQTPLNLGENVLGSAAEAIGQTADQVKTHMLGGSDINESTESSGPFHWANEMAARKRQ